MPVLVKADIEKDEYGNVWYTCHNCGHHWKIRAKAPVECPSCKQHLVVTEKMQAKIKERTAPLEVQDIKEVVPDMFIAQCCECEEDAVGKFNKKMYCEIHLLKAMKAAGVLKDV